MSAEHGNYRAPWTDHGAQYEPISVRSHRMVSQDTAERDWSESIHAVPTGEHPGGGLWDHAEERPLSTRWPHKPVGRYDTERMQRYVELEGTKLTVHEWEVYKYFWEGRLSYGQTARKLECTKDAVRSSVKRLRRKAAVTPS